MARTLYLSVEKGGSGLESLSSADSSDGGAKENSISPDKHIQTENELSARRTQASTQKKNNKILRMKTCSAQFDGRVPSSPVPALFVAIFSQFFHGPFVQKKCVSSVFPYFAS